MTDAEAKAALAGRVSRETMTRLERYADLLTRWQAAINLVSPGSLPHLWARHMLDSAQVLDHAPDTARRWLDLGSGGGFPGLVCAAIAAETRPDLSFTLVEADLRKAAFLRETARQIAVRVGVLSRRIEDVPLAAADVVSARALAPLGVLCGHAERHLAPGGVCLFQKGASHAAELESALEDWQMTVSTMPSVTDPDAVILRIGNLHHA